MADYRFPNNQDVSAVHWRYRVHAIIGDTPSKAEFMLKDFMFSTWPILITPGMYLALKPYTVIVNLMELDAETGFIHIQAKPLELHTIYSDGESESGAIEEICTEFRKAGWAWDIEAYQEVGRECPVLPPGPAETGATPKYGQLHTETENAPQTPRQRTFVNPYIPGDKVEVEWITGAEDEDSSNLASFTATVCDFPPGGSPEFVEDSLRQRYKVGGEVNIIMRLKE